MPRRRASAAASTSPGTPRFAGIRYRTRPWTPSPRCTGSAPSGTRSDTRAPTGRHVPSWDTPSHRAMSRWPPSGLGTPSVSATSREVATSPVASGRRAAAPGCPTPARAAPAAANARSTRPFRTTPAGGARRIRAAAAAARSAHAAAGRRARSCAQMPVARARTGRTRGRVEADIARPLSQDSCQSTAEVV